MRGREIGLLLRLYIVLELWAAVAVPNMIESEGERDDCAEDQGGSGGSIKLHLSDRLGWGAGTKSVYISTVYEKGGVAGV